MTHQSETQRRVKMSMFHADQFSESRHKALMLIASNKCESMAASPGARVLRAICRQTAVCYMNAYQYFHAHAYGPSI